MALKNLINKLHEDNIEVNAIIKAVQPELDEMDIRIIDIFKDGFPIIATDRGIEQWEEILKINANPFTEGIEFRRQRVILRLATNVPFTERFMQWFFDSVLGAGNWEYILDYNKYKLRLIILVPDLNWRNEVNYFLETILPCNIVFSVGELLKKPDMYFASILVQRIKTPLYMETP